MSEPTPEVRAELARLIEQDQTRVGQVYRLTERGLKPDQIAKELGVATSGFVSNNRTMARAALEGHVPKGPSALNQVVAFLRRLVESPSLTGEARAYLADRIEMMGRLHGAESRRLAVSSAHLSPSKSSRSERPTSPPNTLRALAEHELRQRAGSLVERIRSEAGVDADDYLRVATSSSPIDELATLISTHAAGRSFLALHQKHRLDLALETHCIEWAGDLPLRSDVVEASRARLAYYGYEEPHT
jgi:hypothetical protein